MTEFIRNLGLDMQAVVLAGGMGFRMGELAKEQQKCMMEVDGGPIMEHILLGIKDTFGKKTEVIIATGYRGNEIKEYFGNDYQEMKITYVHDDRHLEVRKRLLLVDSIVSRPFLFLAGDILTPNFILEKVVDRFYQEEQNIDNLLGVISGAKDHTPALTHAVFTIDDNHFLKKISYSSLEEHGDSDFRDAHRAIYSLCFLERIKYSEEKLLSRATLDVFLQGNANFGVVEFDGPWGHYAEPNDLEKYQNLPFLRELPNK